MNLNDEYFETRKKSSKIQKKKENKRFSSEKIETEKIQKNSIKDIDEKQKDEEKCPKTKSIIEFDTTLSCSIKSVAIKKKDVTNSQIFSGKMLIIAKISLESFMYDLTEIFFS